MSKTALPLSLTLLAAFIDWMGLGLVYPMFSSMLFDPQATLVSASTSEAARGLWLGILLCINPICLFFAAPLLGALSDRLGRKNVLTYAMIIGVVGYFISWIAVCTNSLALLLVSRAVVGISAGNGAVLSAIIADISESKNKARHFGLLNMAFGVGFSVGPFLGGVLSDVTWYGFGRFEMPFFFAAIVCLINLIGVYFYLPETNVSCRPVVEPIRWYDGLRNFEKALSSKSLRAIYLAVFAFCVGWSFYWEFIPATWIGLFQFSPAVIGSVYGYGAAVYALSCGLLIRPITNRIAAKHLLKAPTVVLGFAILILAWQDSYEPLWVLIPIQQFLLALIFPVFSAVVSDRVAEDKQGEALGILHAMDAGAFAISPIFAGSLLALSIKTPIYIGCLAMFTAVFLLQFLDKKELPVATTAPSDVVA